MLLLEGNQIGQASAEAKATTTKQVRGSEISILTSISNSQQACATSPEEGKATAQIAKVQLGGVVCRATLNCVSLPIEKVNIVRLAVLSSLS